MSCENGSYATCNQRRTRQSCSQTSLGSQGKSYPVSYKVTKGFMVLLLGILGSEQSEGVHRMFLSYAGSIWHKIHFRMKQLIFLCLCRQHIAINSRQGPLHLGGHILASDTLNSLWYLNIMLPFFLLAKILVFAVPIMVYDIK